MGITNFKNGIIAPEALILQTHFFSFHISILLI